MVLMVLLLKEIATTICLNYLVGVTSLVELSEKHWD